MTNTAAKIDFATAASRLVSMRTRAQERRRFRRTPLVVGGRMLDTSGRELDCRTADISPGDVRIAATELPTVGDRVVLYLDGIGRVSGKVARTCGPGEVAIIFDFSAHKREKLAEQLTLAINKDLGIDTPAHRVVTDKSRFIRIEHEAGDAYEGEVLDFSLAGATIRAPRSAPPIGAWVRIGGVYGRVARLIEGGFAVDFEPRGPAKRPTDI